MTEEETKTLLRMMVASYPTFHPDNMKDTITTWHLMLDDLDFKLMTAALKNFIRTNNTGFAPSIGQLIDEAHKITDDVEISEIEAWTMVRKAISNSSYHAGEEFEKFPQEVKRAVGSPSQLRSWATDQNFNEAFVKNSFVKSYNSECKRKSDFQKYSPKMQEIMKKTVAGIDANNLLGLPTE